VLPRRHDTVRHMRVTFPVRLIFLCVLFTAGTALFVHPLAAAPEEATLPMIIAAYEQLKPHVMTRASEIREARKRGAGVSSGQTLEVRKEIADLVKMLRRFDKDHLRAAKGAKTYPDRTKILKLFHTCDMMLRLLDAETKSIDFQVLGLKYEEMWKQAENSQAPETADKPVEETQRGSPEETPVQRLGR